jgi:hypothetical protein
MTSEVVAFWAVLLLFLLADNIARAPAGCDGLRCGRRGSLHYDAGTRLQLRGREAFWLNPLNPFDRLLPTTACAGQLRPAALRQAGRTVRQALPWLNRLSVVGAVYLVLLAVLVAASQRLYFGVVLALLGGLHLTAWTVSLTLLWRGRYALPINGPRRWALAAEALFVPAYTINLAKRVLRHTPQELPALALGLRQWRRSRHQPGDDGPAALQHFQLGQRLDLVEQGLALAGAVGTPEQRWLHQARGCLAQGSRS